MIGSLSFTGRAIVSPTIVATTLDGTLSMSGYNGYQPSYSVSTGYQLCNANSQWGTNNNGGTIYANNAIQNYNSFTVSFQVLLTNASGGVIPNNCTGGNNFYFYCGMTAPIANGTGSAWYNDTTPGMYVNFQVYCAQYFLPAAGTYLVYNMFPTNGIYANLNTEPDYKPLCYTASDGANNNSIGSQNNIQASSTVYEASVAYLNNANWTNVVIQYNKSTTNTWTVTVNDVTVINNNYSGNAGWVSGASTYWGIGSSNYTTSGGSMNSYIRNVSLTYT